MFIWIWYWFLSKVFYGVLLYYTHACIQYVQNFVQFVLFRQLLSCSSTAIKLLWDVKLNRKPQNIDVYWKKTLWEYFLSALLYLYIKHLPLYESAEESCLFGYNIDFHQKYFTECFRIFTQLIRPEFVYNLYCSTSYFLKLIPS